MKAIKNKKTGKITIKVKKGTFPKDSKAEDMVEKKKGTDNKKEEQQEQK